MTDNRDWADATDDSARLRVVIDQVASLTDVTATYPRNTLGI